MKKITLILLICLCFLPLFAKSEWLGKDKIMHFSGSAFLTYWSYGISRNIAKCSQNESKYIAISFTSLMGLGKEASDKHLKKTKWSWKDLAYNAAGIAAGLIIINNTR